MLKLIQNNKDFLSFCSDKGINMDKLMSLPRCYNDSVIRFQVFDPADGAKGLMDDKPAKVILSVQRIDGGLSFLLADDYKRYVG